MLWMYQFTSKSVRRNMEDINIWSFADRQTYLINCYWVYEYNKIVMDGVFPQNCINSLFVHQVSYKCYHAVQTYHQVLCTIINPDAEKDNTSIQVLKNKSILSAT